MVVVSLCLVLGKVLSYYNVISTVTSRKMVHILTGTFQIVFWAYYPDEPYARVYGALGCFIFAIVFMLFGFGIVKGMLSRFMVDSVCREKDAHEMLYGPLNYCLIISSFSLMFWKNYPPAISAIVIMLMGDGMAEIIGKKCGKRQLKNPWGNEKSVEGTVSVTLFGGIGAMAMCFLIYGNMYFMYNCLFGIVGALVEFYSYPNYDNVFIPISIVMVGFCIFN
ncbi:hypothetical protein EIN_172200 [Entamoeba invadens IP1]|uniref:Phosphatidate cytidylyltransferase n=2 Tax=Entamoeba invadens TaxID=33085 RepID=A0A0A1TYH4_ENTIV|nr:hypothetical protein EIN_172200 [Entamoeba invadens IP1]ELP84605.1 hypothetical protein EIN_172200 [Entamoeba invadens IP1]|eukprot:XP_004183951.1 hypothetical protein EIN_172200 [Entamoeba invadens IP1]